jgi:hypothetical protein
MHELPATRAECSHLPRNTTAMKMTAAVVSTTDFLIALCNIASLRSSEIRLE